MIRLLFLRSVLSLAILVVFATFSFAQEDVEQQGGSGAKGRYTAEEARKFALSRVNGEILETAIYREDNRLYHIFKIRTEDGSLYEIEINALTGEVFNVEVDYLSSNPVLPVGLVYADMARSIAHAHIKDKTLGKRNPEVLETTIVAHKRKLAYQVKIKKSAKIYNVMVDAHTGEVITADELR